MWQKKIHPNSWDKLPYWEWEEYIKLMNKRIDEENKKRKEENEQQASSKYNNINPNSFKYNPKNFRPPKF